jgi:preprotein translocase subunit SecF
MFRIFHKTSYDFIRPWRILVGISATFIAIGIGLFVFRAAQARDIESALHWGIEFTGGTLIQLEFDEPPNVADIRTATEEAGYRGAVVQQYGSPRDYTVRAKPREAGTAVAPDDESTAREIDARLRDRFGTGYRMVRSEFIGPRVGEELRQRATLALFISFIVTLIYLAIRFEWRFGIAAVAATLHDVITTIAFISVMNLEVSLTVVAGILTVIGYSLNDTIIIFDRVRENLKKQRRESMRDVLNRSINETLPRTILTHSTTFVATTALLLFAGEVIRPFAWVMMFGIWTGTFSSLYVAAILLLWIERKWPRLIGESKGTARALAAERTRERGGPPVASR